MNNTTDEALDEQKSLVHMVDELLAERQQLLIGLRDLAEAKGNAPAAKREQGLQRFCALLMDYSALWHFELYDYLQKHRAQFANAMQVAELIEQRIVLASERAVDFNDKYDAQSGALDLTTLDKDLSALGEQLAARIEAEDKILSAMVID